MPIESITNGPTGGQGGNIFADDIPDDGVKITRVDIKWGNVIDSIKLTWSDGTTSFHGGNGGGNATTFTLKPNEYLTEISGTYGNVVDSLTLRTNEQTFQKVGGGTDRPFNYQVPEEDFEIIGLLGRAGGFIDALVPWIRHSYQNLIISTRLAAKAKSVHGREDYGGADSSKRFVSRGLAPACNTGGPD
jgi:hypothetical protein